MNKLLPLLVLLGAISDPAWSATQTVTLSVPGMTCAACPLTVKAALKRVPGVQSVDVSFQKLEAVVSFDDARANVDALTKATTGAGYPSKLKK